MDESFHLEVSDTPSGRLLKRAMEISDERGIPMGEAMDVAKTRLGPVEPNWTTTITTEYFGEEEYWRGEICATLHEPLSGSEHLTHVDLTISTVAFQKIVPTLVLKRVDADKLAWLAHEAQRAAGRPVTG